VIQTSSGTSFPTWLSTRRITTGVIVATAGFAMLGTVAALWENPLFFRMTPIDGWEVGLLALLSLLGGIYVAIRRRHCSNKAAGTSGVLGFVGVACPVCNKILLLTFGSELLLTYYEPIRIHVAVVGVIVAMWAVHHEWKRQCDVRHTVPAAEHM